MEKRIFNVEVDWTDDNFCCGLYDENIGGAVLSTGKTFEELKNKFISALEDHIKICVEDGDQLPQDVIEGKYDLNFVLEVPALLRDAERLTSLAALSKVCGINRKQLSHYATGEKKARPDKREKIIAGLHEIGRQALAYS